MDRRTFVKAAATAPLLGASAASAKEDSMTDPWPPIVSLDNPIAHPFPVRFVEKMPVFLRCPFYAGPFHPEGELFRLTAHEWYTDAILFRGFRMNPRDPSSASEIAAAKISLMVDDQRVLDRLSAADFMKESGCRFPPRQNDGKAMHQVFRGWADQDGYSNHDHFFGYFLPNKSSAVVMIEGCNSSAVEVVCDMARYTAKK
jgi:hypothetical protein